MSASLLPPHRNFWQNVRDFPRALSLSGALAGLLVVITGYTGPILIVTAAAAAAGFSSELTASWILAIAVGNGVLTILQSFYYRQPITSPWSTAGAALLVTALPGFTIEQAVGAYILCGIGITLIGMSGWFGRAMALVPMPVVSGLIAGILLLFGSRVYGALGTQNDVALPLIAAAMLLTYFILRRRNSRAPMLGVVLVGTLLAALAGQLDFSGVVLQLTPPVLVLPVFDVQAALTLTIPLMALTLSSQYAPGQAVLRANGYEVPINSILRNGGLGSIVVAFFGGHGTSLGALTAAMVASPENEPNIDHRYASAVMSGVFYILFGLFGTTIIALFASFPSPLVAVVAGLALMGTIVSNLTNATADPAGREAGVAAFLVTVSGLTLFGVAAPFWGLVIGIAVYALLNPRKEKTV